MREILFRGKRVDNGVWVYGSLLIDCDNSRMIIPSGKGVFAGEKVITKSIGQFTGLLDKNGNKIFEGDIIEIKIPYRSTQTHTGNNIPNGSYTEPMECNIKTEELIISFSEGTFYGANEETIDSTPLKWLDIEWDLESIKEAVCWRDLDKDIFEDPDEGDLNYLIEDYNYNSVEDLIKDVSGIKIIGNIHE